jgi:hypothetical protein
MFRYDEKLGVKGENASEMLIIYHGEVLCVDDG